MQTLDHDIAYKCPLSRYFATKKRSQYWAEVEDTLTTTTNKQTRLMAFNPS